MLLLRASVGKNGTNYPDDVKAVHQVLMNIGKIPCYASSGVMDDAIYQGIVAVQRHFLRVPDGKIDVNGTTHKFLAAWSEKPVSSGVVFVGRLQEAWNLVNPLLPEGSYCSSAFRSVEDQRRILHKFFTVLYKTEIIAKYGKAKYDSVAANLVAKESQVLEMVRGVGQAIATPGKSMHQKGRAVDIGGPNKLDAEQVRIVKLVAKANPGLLTGVVLKERNGCVHFEIY